MYLIVGLGNPGKKYEQTRHNVGFWLVDQLAEKAGIAVDKKQCSALTGMGMYQGKKILLAKPQTYMNLSGETVIQLLNYYDAIDEMIIIHDDLDLPPGTIRFKDGGGLGGHNGLKSITRHLHSQDYERLRVGIGRPDRQKVVNYVLEPFSAEDKTLVDQALKEAIGGLELWLEKGIQPAMNQYNQKKNGKEPKEEQSKKDSNESELSKKDSNESEQNKKDSSERELSNKENNENKQSKKDPDNKITEQNNKEQVNKKDIAGNTEDDNPEKNINKTESNQ